MPPPDHQPTGVIHEVIRELSAGLSASLRTSAALEHSLTVGEFREARVRQALARHLPGRFELSTGIAINSEGSRSKQLDVVVTDRSASSPFVSEGIIGLHPIETVHAVIEVKSDATPDAVGSAVENCVSVKRLLSEKPRPLTRVGQKGITFGETAEKPFYGVVCFRSGMNFDALHEAYAAANRGLAAADRCNAFVVLDKFAIVWASGMRPGRPLVEPSPLGGTIAYQAPVGEHALLLFYLVLLESLNRYEPPPLDLMAYVNAGGGVGAHEGFAIQVERS